MRHREWSMLRSSLAEHLSNIMIPALTSFLSDVSRHRQFVDRAINILLGIQSYDCSFPQNLPWSGSAQRYRQNRRPQRGRYESRRIVADPSKIRSQAAVGASTIQSVPSGARRVRWCRSCWHHMFADDHRKVVREDTSWHDRLSAASFSEPARRPCQCCLRATNSLVVVEERCPTQL